jgi:hypothetical protein
LVCFVVNYNRIWADQSLNKLGDFIAVLNLFKDLGLALHDQAGSSSDYQKTVVDLETIAAILLELQNLQPADGNLSQINSIRGQASRIFHDVQQFLSSINKYNDTLGTRAARGFHHGTFAKIKWPQLVAPKVKELRKAVHLQTANIQTLLSLLIQHNQNLDRTLLACTLAQQSFSIDSLAEKVESFELNLRQNPNPADEKVTNKAIVDKTCTKDYDGRTSLVSHLPALSPNSPSTSSEQTGMTIITHGSEGNIATPDDLRRLETLIKSHFQDKMPDSGRP